MISRRQFVQGASGLLLPAALKARSPRGFPRNAPAQFSPGVYMLSINVNGWTASVTGANSIAGNGRNASEITKIVAAQAAHPTIMTGYSPQYTWAALDGGGTLGTINAAGLNDDFQKYVAACASSSVTARFVPQIAGYAIWNSTFDANGGIDSQCIPSYINSGGSATYGDPPSGGSGAGWTFSTYSSPNYAFVAARFDNANVNAKWKAMWGNLANTSLIALSGPFTGVVYTWGTHPQVAGMVDWTDESPNMAGNPTTPADWSSANYDANRWNQAANIPSLLPNTPWALMGGYGASGQPRGDQLTLIENIQSGGAGLSSSDVFWSGTATDFTYAQNYFTGLTWNGSAWVSGGTVYAGSVLSMPDVQPVDYHKTNAGSSTQAYTQAQVTNIVTVAYNQLKAQYLFMASDDDRYAGNWASYILPGIVAAGPNPNVAYP